MKRIPVIDFFRFLSIFLVIGGHFFPRWVASWSYPPVIRQIILGAFLNGAYGVTFFFVVSGFLITQLLVESSEDFSTINLKSFYVKRAARIFPLLFAFVLLGLLMESLKPFVSASMVPYHTGVFAARYGWGFWLTLFSFCFNWYLALDSHGIGMHWGILWSLAIEEQFYFFYPVTLRFLNNRKRVLFFLGSIILIAVFFRGFSFLCFKAGSDWMHWASFGAFDQIAVGGILFFASEHLKKSLQNRPWISFLFFLSGLVICLELYLGTSFDDGIETILTPTLLAMGCALAILGGLHLPFLNSKWGSLLSWPGKLSYGCYLLHPAVIFVLLPLLAWTGGLGALLLLLAGVWTAAYFSYYYFEVPVNHRIRTLFNLKPSQTL